MCVYSSVYDYTTTDINSDNALSIFVVVSGACSGLVGTFKGFQVLGVHLSSRSQVCLQQTPIQTEVIEYLNNLSKPGTDQLFPQNFGSKTYFVSCHY